MIQEIRAFNRFYTGVIGLLNRHLLDSTYSLAEARILYELAHRRSCLATDLIGAMRIDKSYLSRLLHKLEKDGLITRARSTTDGRASALSLTGRGKQEFKRLDRASDEQVRQLILPLSQTDQQRLLAHFTSIMDLLSAHHG